MNKSHRLYAVLFVLLISLTACANTTINSPSELRTLTVDGIERSYRIYIPQDLGEKPAPVMLALHGGLGFAEETERTTGLNKIADKNHFIAVYPNGIGGRIGKLKKHRTWNAGDCCGRAVRENIDDVKFLKAVINDIIKNDHANRRRIYITGISNGAMMAYRMACEAPELIAAIVPVSGTLALNRCKDAKSVPVLHIHGSADSNVPLRGGKGKSSIAGVKHRSVLDTIKRLRAARNCETPRKKKNVETDISTYACQSGAPLQFWLVNGGEHVWPGGKSKRNSKMSNGSFSGSEAAWKFASQHSK